MKIYTRLMLTTAAVAAFSTGSAFAADLNVPAQPAPPVVAAPTNWDGPYIGASIGYGWGTASLSYTNASGGIGNGVVSSDSVSPSGWLLGAQLGYNFHLANQIVAGVEGNIDWVNETSTFGDVTLTDGTVLHGGSANVNWEGSIRGRLGFDAGNFLPYIEAGVAFANADANFNDVNVNATRTGWTAGLGVEWLVAQQVSINAEWRYADYGSAGEDFTNGTVVLFNPNSPVHFTDNTFRLGLNYHF